MIDRSLFNVEDFLIDNTFQLYCAGTDQLCVTYWENYIESHPEQKEIIDEARRIYVILSGNKKPLEQQVTQLKQNIGNQKGDNILPIHINYKWLKIAAVILLIASGSLFYFTQNAQDEVKKLLVSNFSTKAGEKKRIKLSDGSIISLNAGSRLSIVKGFNEETREVNLIGEAFFDVKHNANKPFKVHTEDFDINVLGTSFNVKIYPGEPTSEATLIKGLIVMEGKGAEGSSITLKPSQKVTFYKIPTPPPAKQKPVKLKKQLPEITINHYTKVNDSVIAEVAWTQNRLEISDKSFAEIKAVLERWYNVEIKFEGSEVEKYHFTASFSGETVREALNALQTAQYFNYEIKGKQISISK